MSFIGNPKIVEFFDQAIAIGQLSHAYCFVGPKQVGKETLARIISAKLLGVEAAKLAVSPDYCYLRREIDEKTGKLKKDISIKQIRDLKTRLSGKSWSGGYRLAIIDGAQYLNAESGSALLKILEDGGEKLVFFLLATDDNLLLPTIRSRCQLFYFSVVSNLEITNYLISQGVDHPGIKAITEFALGLPGRVVDLQQNPALLIKYEDEKKRWQKMIHSHFNEKVKSCSEFFSGKTVDKEKLARAIGDWQIIWRKALLNMVESERPRTIQKKTIEFIDFMAQAKILLRQNVNSGLVLEEILLHC